MALARASRRARQFRKKRATVRANPAHSVGSGGQPSQRDAMNARDPTPQVALVGKAGAGSDFSQPRLPFPEQARAHAFVLRDDAFDEQALQRDSQPFQARRNDFELRLRREGIVQIETRGRQRARNPAPALSMRSRSALPDRQTTLWPSAISTRATPSNGLM